MFVLATRATLAVALLWLVPVSVLAQDSQTTPTSDPGFDGEETREQILEGPRWKKLVQRFDDWMSVQEIYTEGQTAELVRELRKKVESLTAPQLKDFIEQTEKQLDVLLSKEARAARTELSVATMEYRQKLLARNGMMPNVFGMSVEQLRQELANFQARRESSAAANAEFNRAREQQVTDIQANKRAQQQLQMQARDQAIRSAQRTRTPPRSPYVPRSGPPAPRPRFYVNSWGGVMMSLP